jgi:hypothetical protein
MAARRLLIVMVILLTISTLAAALVPPPPEREETSTTSTSTTTTTGDRPARDGRLVRETIRWRSPPASATSWHSSSKATRPARSASRRTG